MRRRTRLALLFNTAAWLCFALVALGAAGLTQGELVVKRALGRLDAP